VVLTKELGVDEAATRTLRARLRSERQGRDLRP
jgi:hypothetical protein